MVSGLTIYWDPRGAYLLGLLTWIPLQEYLGRFFRIQVDLGLGRSGL